MAYKPASKTVKREILMDRLNTDGDAESVGFTMIFKRPDRKSVKHYRDQIKAEQKRLTDQFKANEESPETAIEIDVQETIETVQVKYMKDRITGWADVQVINGDGDLSSEFNATNLDVFLTDIDVMNAVLEDHRKLTQGYRESAAKNLSTSGDTGQLEA